MAVNRWNLRAEYRHSAILSEARRALFQHLKPSDVMLSGGPYR